MVRPRASSRGLSLVDAFLEDGEGDPVAEAVAEAPPGRMVAERSTDGKRNTATFGDLEAAFASIWGDDDGDDGEGGA